MDFTIPVLELALVALCLADVDSVLSIEPESPEIEILKLRTTTVRDDSKRLLPIPKFVFGTEVCCCYGVD